MKQVIQPAIDLAKKGFYTPLALHMSISARAERLAKNEEAKRIYLQGSDAAPSPGTLFQQGDLARTLTRIRDKGADGFYTRATHCLRGICAGQRSPRQRPEHPACNARSRGADY